MDTKKLRQKILDLAIRGKLVPQDPNDEPASVLLERIRAEKEQLIKEGKIKRSKKSAASDTSHYENVPFEVPESWEWVTVGDIFTHNTGKALNSSNSQGEIMSYITTSNLYWNRFDLSVIKEMPFTESEVAKCTVTRGDLLVCEGGDIGRAAIWNYDFDIRIQNHIHRLRSIIQLNHLFYYHVFYLFKSLNLIGGKGVAIQGLSSSDLAKLLVPLPPISEQNRIVSELNRWLSVVDQIELDQYSLKNTIADIKNRILCLAISGKLVGQDISDEPAIELLEKINPSYISCDNRHYENVQYPDSWEVVKMGEMVRIISGVAYSKSDVTISGIKVIRGGNIQAGEIIECDDDVYIDNRYADPTNNIYKGDIVLVASTGSQQLIGKTGFATRDYVQSQIGAFLRILRPKDIRCADFLNLFFQSDYYRQYIRSLAKGTNINNVKNSYIEDFVIGLPPLQEQNRIVAFTNKIFYMMDEILAGL